MSVPGPRGRRALLAGLLLAGCATVETPPAPPRQPEPPPVTAVVPEAGAAGAPGEEANAARRPPGKGKPARKPALKALPDRPLNTKADCSFVDPHGYRGAMRLDVADARVRAFRAEVTVPEHGSCSFDLGGFRQIETLPNPRLRSERSRCEVRMWETHAGGVTVAFHQCQDMCTSRGAHDRLWPILVNAGGGGCG